jgi:hypothetical protein
VGPAGIRSKRQKSGKYNGLAAAFAYMKKSPVDVMHGYCIQPRLP